jgi:hypothetical protein
MLTAGLIEVGSGLRPGSGEDYITSSFMICTPHQYYSGDQIEKNEMGGVYSM